MGARGPCPLPTNILTLRKSWKAATRTGEPVADGMPDCPDIPDDAAEIWAELIPMLDRLQVLGEIDGGTLERYCRYAALWRKAVAVCEQPGGSVTVTEKGMSDSAEFRQMVKLGQELLKIEQQFGMTPSARARLAKPKAERDPEDEDLFGVAG